MIPMAYGASVRPLLWTPAQLTTALWLEAFDPATLFDATSAGSLVAADGAVARMEDKSGNTRHYTQIGGTNRPLRKVSILNSKDVIRLDGTNDAIGRVSDTTSQNTNALSIFVVATNNGGDATRRALLRFNNNASSARAGVWATPTGIEAGGRRLDADSFQSVSATAPGATTLGAGIFDYANATLQVGVNGTYTSRSGGFQTAGSTSNTASSEAIIGSNLIATSAELLQGDWFAGVVVRGILGTSDRQKLEGYLAHAAGIQASLPGGHPYQSTPPYV